MADNKLAPKSLNAFTDVINRGAIAGTLGAPVDATTMLMRPFGYSVDTPVGGSEWLGQKMEDLGVVSPTRRPLAELAAGFALPAGAAAKTMLRAAKDALTARTTAQAATSAEENLLGLSKARENNTFVYNPQDMSQGYGRRVGYPQPAGTSSTKLFSNFADQKTTPQAASNFREQMLDRALKSPKQFTNDKVSTSVLPFKSDMSVVIEAADKGNTRLQVMKDNVPVASARLQNGLLDSIAVQESAKGQGIGSDLLQFIHETKIGNVLEVPDRSPGFIKIQRELVKKLESAN
tara:strand:- start:15 stop:887 length:873 start_codon:yes stop_codon:yes gene_type:complete